jgi:hypothetical protein
MVHTCKDLTWPSQQVLIAIFPTNHRLLDPTLDRSSAEAHRLLTRWGRLHELLTC